MKIAAIVVAHNSAADLPDSLGCLTALPLDRIVVVDNASTDGSAELARSFTPHVLTLTNVGFGAAVNAAVAATPQVDADLLVNPDCRLAADQFAPLVDAVLGEPRLGAVAPLMRYPDGGYGISAGPEPSMAKEWLAATHLDRLVPRRLKRYLAGHGRLRSRIRLFGYLRTAPGPGPGTRTVAWVCGFCTLVRATAFHEVGGFDPRFFLYFEDVDLCRRLRRHGWAVASVGAAVADHRESTSTARVGKRPLYRSGMVVYFSIHGTRRQRFLAHVLRRLPI